MRLAVILGRRLCDGKSWLGDVNLSSEVYGFYASF